MKRFKIDPEFYNEGEILFKKKMITIRPGVTVLVGCNGVGKSTLIQHISQELNNRGIEYIKFNNLNDGGSNSIAKAGFYRNFDMMGQLLLSSEGESIVLNIGEVMGDIGNFCRKNTDKDELWILFDAIDSGLSIDNIIQVKDAFDAIIDTNRNKKVYIIVAANTYELARNEQCFDVYNCNYTTFKDYEEYRDFIINSSKIKAERYETTE